MKLEGGPIEEVEWGKFVINGVVHSKKEDGTISGVGKDIKLVGRRVEPWRERRGHTLKKEMVESILQEDLDILIIGNGFLGAIDVSDDVIEFLKSGGIKEVHILKTPDACRLYNKLFSKGLRVGLLAHGTC